MVWVFAVFSLLTYLDNEVSSILHVNRMLELWEKETTFYNTIPKNIGLVSTMSIEMI